MIVITCALLAVLVTVLPCASTAVLTTDQGAPAQRITSIQGLSAEELVAYELQGKFRTFLGTPIDANHFITAQHVGISITDTITFDQGPNTGTYSILGWQDDPGSDLRIVEIDGTFSTWALLYGSPDETSRTATIFGRGGPPNGPVVVNAELKGWLAGSPDGQISWGRNVVTNTLGPKQIYARFDSWALSTEAGLSVGDSGGAWFLQDDLGLTRLAAISLAVTGPFQTDGAGVPSGVFFEAVLFDVGGLWVGNPGGEIFVAENPVNVPGVGIATRISDRLDWIGTIVSLDPEDSDEDGIPDAFDNCPFVPNASQYDNGGIGSATADGIGNACQCGDVTGEGQVNDTDAAFIKRHALGLAAPLFLVSNNCDVNGDGRCNGSDATLIRHAAAGTVSPLFGQHCANAMP